MSARFPQGRAQQQSVSCLPSRISYRCTNLQICVTRVSRWARAGRVQRLCHFGAGCSRLPAEVSRSTTGHHHSYDANSCNIQELASRLHARMLPACKAAMCSSGRAAFMRSSDLNIPRPSCAQTAAPMRPASVTASLVHSYDDAQRRPRPGNRSRPEFASSASRSPRTACNHTE